MSEELINLLNDKEKIEKVKIEYSSRLKVLVVFSDKKLYVIDNITEKPKIRLELKIEFKIIKAILHPRNENQLLIFEENKISIIKNLKDFSKQEEIKTLKIPNKNIISIKFSFFNDCFGVLYKDKIFDYYLIKENGEFEIICEINNFDNDYIDFNFCPLFSKGFEIFMIFFMTKNGEINMYGPFFPNELYLPKEFIFNMENYLIYRIGTMENSKNSPENTIYFLSLNVIDDLKKSIQKNPDINNDYIKISEKMKIFNKTFRKREIKIHNNFLVNNASKILDKSYKQIHILNKRPLTILRISDKNDIDLIILGEEIMPLELVQIGNFTSEPENNINSINNFFIEFIKLDNNGQEYKDNSKKLLHNNEEKDKEKIKIKQYNNEEIFIKTNDSLFFVKLPYLNNLKTVSEEKLIDIPNKMNKTTIIKIFKWNNEKKNQKTKSININDILILPEFRRLFIFAILEENIKGEAHGSRRNVKIVRTLKIKEKNYIKEVEKADFSKFENILFEKTEFDSKTIEIKNKLNENDFINCSDLLNENILINEDILKDKKIDFEKVFNKHMDTIYNYYKNLIQNYEEIFNKKINIMKDIYNDLENSDIKKVIDETIEKINKLKKKKEEIEEKKEKIEKKIETVKDKISKYELEDEEIKNYLNILEKYQKKIDEKLDGIEKKIEYFEKGVDKIFSFTKLFPNFDLNFNLITNENQKKYLKFERNVMSNSNSMNNALSKI